MERLFSSLLFLTLVIHSASLAIKSAHDESESKQANDEIVQRKLENDAAQLVDLDELRKSYGMLLDNMVRRRAHPFGWGLRRYKDDHPFGYGRFGAGDSKTRRNHPFRDHPFGFSLTRNNRYGDHPFGFGVGKRRDNAPASNTKAFHGRRDMADENSSLNDDQNMFDEKKKKDLVSEWLDDKMMRE